MNSMPKSSPEKEVVKSLEAGGVVDYLEYLQSGKRIMWVNFKAGVARGLGMTVGATLVLGVTIWILTMLVDLPVVGEYFSDAQQYITEYAERTNYEDEFAEQIRLLQEIDESNKQLINTSPEVD
ncbi:MAG: hypothetical protein KJN61_07555 [Gammaproteobacteria bacterium]|nr:hypothetical protein [Gammaproteobacteria bacterium]MBT8076307.1 hypothetical protein [Gammaproteobacteria bacterium]NNK98541.1 hypothetical protein [Xanthomonadales bacterium]